MGFILFASYGYAWASGAAFLIGIFAAFMSTGKSENELWRRFSILSFVNTAFCISGVWQNQSNDAASIFIASQWNLAGGMLLGPAFLDFVLCVAKARSRRFASIAWFVGILWVILLLRFPDLMISHETDFISMPLHYYRYTTTYLFFQATLFGMIVVALFELWRNGIKLPERTGLMRFVLPSCILWAACGFWDTTISSQVRIPLPLSWAGGVTVNVAFLAFVTRRSQEAFHIQAKHRSIMKDVGHAREIQLGLITRDFPAVDRIRIFGKYVPMEELGGDFFDVRKLDRDRAGIFISDVTGHGIASAFITAMIKISLESLSDETLYDPEKVINHINETLLDKIMDRFITGAYGVLDSRYLTFTFCSAGHHPPILHYRAAQKKAFELETHGRLMGALDDLQLQKQKIQLSPGDRLLLATDGTYEVFNAKGEMFGLARLKSIFETQLLNSLDPLFLEIHRFSPGAKQADDMAGILISIDG